MSKDAASESLAPLLTREGIAARVAERLKLRKAELAAREKGEAIDRWLEHCKGVIGEAMWRELVPSELYGPQPTPHEHAPAANRTTGELSRVPLTPLGPAKVPMARRGQSLISWARSVLAASDNGLKFEDWIVESKLTLGPDGPHKDPTEFLRFLDVSANRGRLRKKGDSWYSVDTPRPEKETVAKKGRTRGRDLRAALMEALVKLGGRADGTAIIQLASANPLVAEILSKSRQYPRAMLSRMAIERELEKEGKDFVLPKPVQRQREFSAEAAPYLQLVGEAQTR